MEVITTMVENKERKLIELLTVKKKVIIALSGGVDSTLLLYIASKIPVINVLAVTAKSPLHMSSEVDFAQKYTKQLGVEHKVIDIPLLNFSDITENNKDRCYYCKKKVFSIIIEKCQKYKNYYIADGTNMNDFDDYRPGLKACQELLIWHPFAEAEMYKSDIYELSKKYDLPTANKPSFACLASRIPYGTQLTKENLHKIEQGEIILQKQGFKQYRLRYHGDIARIEIFAEDFKKLLNDKLRNEIVSSIKAIGFKYITLDLSGYKQGSLNI